MHTGSIIDGHPAISALNAGVSKIQIRIASKYINAIVSPWQQELT
jgi:hypothetical protein